MSRQQDRATERDRIKEMELQNKTFHEKFKMQNIKLKLHETYYKTEIAKLQQETDRLQKENKQLSIAYNKFQESEREKSFNESFGKVVTNVQILGAIGELAMKFAEKLQTKKTWKTEKIEVVFREVMNEVLQIKE